MNIGYNLRDMFKSLKNNPYNKGLYDIVSRLTVDESSDLLKSVLEYNKYLYDNPDEVNGFVPFMSNTRYDELVYSLSLSEQSDYIGTMSKNVATTTHDYEKLRGTLSKANFIYDSESDSYNENLKSCEYFIRNMYKTCRKNTNDKIALIFSIKYDGMSIILTVEDGIISKAVTRGDVDKTTDLSSVFAGLPFNGVDGGYKTEAVMDNYQFSQYCDRRNYDFSNPRVAVSTLSRLLDSRDFNDLVTFKTLGYVSNSDDNRMTQIENIVIPENILDSRKTFDNYRIVNAMGLDDALNKINEYANIVRDLRESLTIPIDGIVIEIADEHYRNILGREDSINKYEFALKFDSNEAETTIKAIDFTVGRTGKITPRVWYDDIIFFGTTHKKASVASVRRFNDLKLGQGDLIKVSYNNDVIPYVAEVVKRSDNKRYKFPDKCPVCDHSLTISDTGKEAFCVNQLCPSKVILNLVKFLKSGFGIENFSTMTITRIYKAGLIDFENPYRSLFDLKLESLLKIEGMGDITSNALIDELSRVKTLEHVDVKILASLDISVLGSKTLAKILARHTMDELFHKIDITYISGIGKITMTKLYDWLDNNAELWSYLNEILNIKNFKDICANESESERIEYCTSGFRPSADVLEKLTAKGYKYNKSMTKSNTKLLIVRDLTNNSGTVDKANKYNIPIKLLDEVLID